MERTSKNKIRRPEKPLYVPRALRAQNDFATSIDGSSCENDNSNLTKANTEVVEDEEEKQLKILNVKKQSFDKGEQNTGSKINQEFISDRTSVFTSDYPNITDFDPAGLKHERNIFVESNISFVNANNCDENVEISSCENLKSTNSSQIHENEAHVENVASTKDSFISSQTLDHHEQNESESMAIEHASSSNETNVPDETEMVKDSWDVLYNDDGEVLKPDIMKQLQAVVGNAKIVRPKHDYREFKCEEMTVDDELSSVVELYDFPVEFKTQDILAALSTFKSDNFVIKWVDDCHAISMFSSPFLAHQALELKHPFIKVRPISQGLPESKLKARRLSKDGHFRPPVPRPATSAVLAKRLVSGALGMKANISKAEKDRERQLMKEVRGRRQKASKHKEDIWNGDVS